jgi:hypothetical protein
MADWTPFRTYYISGNLVVQAIESGTSGCVARNYDHETTEVVVIVRTYY